MTLHSEPPAYRFYGDVAPWWPLISPPSDYTDESAHAADFLASAAIPVREVLELGSGGGHSAVHLKQRFSMTLVDTSASMLAMSRKLNPLCEHLQGDMRSVRLGRLFDAVFIHDAIDYMATEADLRAAMATAYAHCRPGGVVVLVPDDTRETFAPGTDHGGTDGPDGAGARYLEWSWDPDRNDSWVLTSYTLVLRDPTGADRVVHETHRHGLFSRAQWLAWLQDAGFSASTGPQLLDPAWGPRELFIGHRAISLVTEAP